MYYLDIALRSWRQKGWCDKPTILQFESILNTKRIDALRTATIRRVARVLLKWKHFQAGGFGAALRPPMGPGRSPGGGPGGEAPGSYWILHIYNAVFYVKNYPFFKFLSMIFTPWFYMQDDSISILLK